MKPIVLRPAGEPAADNAFDVIRPDLFAEGQGVAAPFQFAVVPLLGHHDHLERALAPLPPDYLAAARDGRLGLVLDYSLEAMNHLDRRLDGWHAALARRFIPPEHCLVLTQGRQFANGYRAYCDRTGRVNRLRTLPYDYMLKRQALAYGDKGPAIFETRLKRFQQRAARRPSLFLSMNYKPRPHRFAFLVRLIRNGLLNKGLVSFGGLEQDRMVSAAVTWERPPPVAGLTDSWFAAGFESELDTLLDLGALSLPDDVLTALPSGLVAVESLIADADSRYFDESYFSAVLETEMVHVRHRVTEKPLKPLANFHPFVLFGNHRSLEMLRGFGFRTFEGLIDERYDLIVSPEGRFNTAMMQFMRLCRLADVGKLDVGAVDDAVIHNAEFMLTRFADSYAAAYDVPVIEAMAEIAAAAIAGAGRRR